MSTTEVAKATTAKKTVSHSETGHSKNIANFEDLISFCIGYGAAYKPSKETLSISRLKELQTQALTDLQQMKVAKANLDNATNARRIMFSDLKPLSTKLVNALAVSGSNDLTVANAKTINRKMQGARAKGIINQPASVDGTTPTVKSISTSQLSFDSQIDHFTKLIETVSQEKSFAPNEVELQTKTLQIKLDAMKSVNSDLINRYTNWSNTRIKRNETIYNPLTGLVQTALEVKLYIKSVFGASSPQYKQVNGIKFKTIKE
jgi:hypothetical protein